jgi:hypothetical protein
MATQTFLQISFGENNFLSNTSTSADGAVGMPGYAYLNPTKGSSAAPPDVTKLQSYAFANAKALTALVQISAGEFVSAEWNWDKADSRCTRSAAAAMSAAVSSDPDLPQPLRSRYSFLHAEAGEPVRPRHRQSLHQQPGVRRHLRLLSAQHDAGAPARVLLSALHRAHCNAVLRHRPTPQRAPALWLRNVIS